MKQSALVIAIVLLVLFLIVGSGCLFVVNETQQVVITQFGEAVKPLFGGEGDKKAIKSPGVKFKIPFIQTARFFEKRFLEWDGDRNQVPTKDKRFIWVDTYARWQIVDPLLFYQRLTDESRAQSRLDDIIDGATRDAVANHNLMELVRSSNREVTVDPNLPERQEEAALLKIDKGRVEIMEEIQKKSAARAGELGIEVIDVRFKRINYNDDVRQNVYQRMIAERQRIAERFRSEGLGESARIRGEKERDLKQITSEAYRKAQELVGQADGEAAGIYAAAYSRDAEFYRFLKTMETYPKTLDKDTWLILSTDSEFFHFLNKNR